MKFLLDTNVISEWVKPEPDRGLMAWLHQADEDSMFLSVISLMELRYGVDRLAVGRRRSQLETWLRDDLALRFEGRILDIDSVVADACGRLVARREAVGRPIALMDAFLAATAEVEQLTVVTRNDSHFRSVVESVLNPWSSASR